MSDFGILSYGKWVNNTSSKRFTSVTFVLPFSGSSAWEAAELEEQ